MAAPTVLQFDTVAEVSDNLCKFVVDKANKAIEARNRFTVGVSGGSLAKFLCDNLPQHKTDWEKWQIFFCDERYVPIEDKECTYSVYKNGLMSKVPIKDDQVFPAFKSDDASVEEAARRYEATIRRKLPGEGLPRFDVLLLGMGPDGHTCSLFPGHSLLQETEKLIAAISDSPKPPPERVTMTFPLLNNAACAVFASCGASKADILERVLKAQEDLPASRVKLTDGQVVWFLDKDAAAKL